LEAGDGEKVAIRYGDTQVTYAQLHEEICAAGNVLEALGVRREDRVLMILDDSPTFVALFLGAMRAGAVPAPVSFLDTTENFAHYARDSYAKAIIAEDALLDRLPRGTMPRSEFERLLQQHRVERLPADTHPDDMAFWLFSGGSTGFPKGVVHLHHDIPYTCETYAREILQISESDVCYSTTKLFHAYGLGNGLSFPYSVGATTVLASGRSNPARALELAERFKPTLFFSVPALFRAMLDQPEADLSSVRMCISAAEPLHPGIEERWEERYRVPIVDGIGSTEMLHIYCSNRVDDIRRGTSGKPVRGYELRLDDDTGELFVRGDSCAAYYWHQHEKSKHCMVGEWFASGDRYRVDDDGYYVYEGRMDDMLKIGGLWVSPTDMETALMQHPGVSEAVVIGVEVDEVSRIKAFVIAAEGQETGDALADVLRGWCKERLRRYEYPHFVEFVDELPRTVTGKVQRFKLREREAAR
jgi:benzoate-CoA ligase